MKMKCYHVDCGYEWDYKGSAPFYATCPRCLRKLKITRARVGEVFTPDYEPEEVVDGKLRKFTINQEEKT